ncbi:hypothetical protein F4679DRAFT_221953 [Xylaria curta]|nr:hypothetical protein F4679DRAFT_221953 [Xylaria curta]
MSTPWLSFFSLPIGFQGLCMLETHQSLLSSEAPTVLCIGSDSKSRFLDTIGIDAHNVADTVSLFPWQGLVIMDCHASHSELRKIRGGPVPKEAKSHYLRAPTRDSVYGRLLRPFVHMVVFFVEDFAGLVQSAVTLARWVQLSMSDTIPTPPRLLVVHDGGDPRAFCRQIDTELLVMLRKISPERPYSMREIVALREKCFSSVAVTNLDAVDRDILAYSPPEQPAQSFEAKFRLMLGHICEHASAPFDLLGAADAEAPLPSCSVRYVERFIAHARRSGVDPVPQLALSFSREVAGDLFSHFAPEEIWTRRYVPLLEKVQIRPHDPLLTSRVEKEMRRLARRSQILGDSIAHVHRASLGNIQAREHVFLCFSCLMRPPIHTLSCLHRICTYCLVTYMNEDPVADCTPLVRQCPFCKASNGRQLYVQPAMARARVLVLRNLSVLSAVCLIRDIRTRLFGPIHEYIDLVVGVNEGRLVVHDLFVQGLSARESLERHASRKPLSWLRPTFTRPVSPQAHAKLPGSLQIALQEGSKISTSWGEVVKCPDWSSLAELPAAITTDFWTSCDIMGVGARDNATRIAAALAASLFYVQVCSRVDYDGTSYELVVLCRLEPGPHLVALLNGLKLSELRLHYQIDEAPPDSAPVCSDANWAACKAGQPFTRLLRVIDSLEAELHVDIDSLTQPGAREPVSNSPCMARAVVVLEGEHASAPASARSSTIFSDVSKPDSVSSVKSISGVLHAGPEKAVKVVTADPNGDNESIDQGTTPYEPKEEGGHSQIFRGIDHLQELLVQIKRQNR